MSTDTQHGYSYLLLTKIFSTACTEPPTDSLPVAAVLECTHPCRGVLSHQVLHRTPPDRPYLLQNG